MYAMLCLINIKNMPHNIKKYAICLFICKSCRTFAARLDKRERLIKE